MKVLILAAVLAVVSATSPPANPSVYTAVYPTDDAAPAPGYATPAYNHRPAQPYSFEWEVKDAESYNDYSHSESSDGKVVTGSYSVLLPDGRVQVVTYKADAYGYTANVKYIGESKYPEPATYSAPDYKTLAPFPAPAPSLYPALVYEVPDPSPLYEAPAPAPAPIHKVVPAIYRGSSPAYKIPVY